MNYEVYFYTFNSWFLDELEKNCLW